MSNNSQKITSSEEIFDEAMNLLENENFETMKRSSTKFITKVSPKKEV
ncbi:hypothetical protein [Methanobrevibacter sp. DSM 116169]